jgi:hypothetical protein
MVLRKNFSVFIILSVFVSITGVTPFIQHCIPGAHETGSTDLAFESPDSDGMLTDHVGPLHVPMPDDFSGVSFLVDSWQDLSSLSFQGSHFHSQMIPLRC